MATDYNTIPFGKPATVAYTDLKKWVTDLLGQAKATTGYGYTVVLETRTTRRYGEQSLPEQILIETERDFCGCWANSAKLIDSVQWLT